MKNILITISIIAAVLALSNAYLFVEVQKMSEQMKTVESAELTTQNFLNVASGGKFTEWVKQPK